MGPRRRLAVERGANMELDLLQKDVQASGELRGFVQQRVTAALDRFEQRILRVSVRIRDVNGPKGGAADHECQIQVKLRAAGDPLIVAESAATPEAAVALAADAAREVVRRAVGKMKRGVGGEAGSGALDSGGAGEPA